MTLVDFRPQQPLAARTLGPREALTSLSINLPLSQAPLYHPRQKISMECHADEKCQDELETLRLRDPHVVTRTTRTRSS